MMGNEVWWVISTLTLLFGSILLRRQSISRNLQFCIDRGLLKLLCSVEFDNTYIKLKQLWKKVRLCLWEDRKTQTLIILTIQYNWALEYYICIFAILRLKLTRCPRTWMLCWLWLLCRVWLWWWSWDWDGLHYDVILQNCISIWPEYLYRNVTISASYDW